MKRQIVINLLPLLCKAGEILSGDCSRTRKDYVHGYYTTLDSIRAALEGEGCSCPCWTEGKGGWETYEGMKDALEDARKMGVDVLFVDYGSISCSCGAHEAANPARWEGWPSDILKGNTPYREALKEGMRPSEADIAETSARWVAENPTRRAKATPAIYGHYGQCAYMSVYVA